MPTDSRVHEQTYMCDTCHSVHTMLQGPFKKPEEVIRQKFRPLQPTLRVATAYDSVEAARYLCT